MIKYLAKHYGGMSEASLWQRPYITVYKVSECGEDLAVCLAFMYIFV